MSRLFGTKKSAKSVVYTIEECTSCGLKTKRDFQSGDYVYKEGGECTKCKGKSMINMIYSEKVEK
ncbi:MAG: hypothetical protein L6N95_01710 [Candidatus Methylarchaceae archaeon HK01B]|nr:hypothetical protein [Candidatus Methylarchaceae archaeon HK02M1]MCP8318529.1 hypothetical protein [Candidatus Methylarchaceae archaeon HK01B]